MRIRDADKSDAARLITLFSKLDTETDCMLFEPGERRTTLAEQEAILNSFANDGRGIYLVAEAGAIEGFCVIAPGRQNRNRHVGSLVIGVEMAAWFANVGSSLMEQALHKAEAAGMTRIELTVRTDNPRAIALYEKFGFVREGVRADSLVIGGELKSEYYMARLKQ